MVALMNFIGCSNFSLHDFGSSINLLLEVGSFYSVAQTILMCVFVGLFFVCSMLGFIDFLYINIYKECDVPFGQGPTSGLVIF